MRGVTAGQNSSHLANRPIVLGLGKVLFLLFTRIPLVSALPTPLVSFSHRGLLWLVKGDGGPEPKPAEDPSLWLYLGIAVALVLGGGAFAGLTIALMGQVRPLSLPLFSRMMLKQEH
jgi:metal transporter CNNM